MRAYYSEFVGHCLRFYARHPQPRFETDANKKNWFACDTVLKPLSDVDRELILELYGTNDNLLDNVGRLAKRYQIKQDSLWRIIDKLERKVAKARGVL